MTTPSLNPLDYKARFQFNQPNTPAWLAKTACTDTCVQMIIEYWTEKLVPLTKIRADAGGPTDGVHGLTVQMSLTALRKNGIYWYTWKNNVDGTFILQQAYKAPVLTGVAYSAYPRKVKTCTAGPIAEVGGKIDCPFRGPHAVLVLGNRKHLDASGNLLHYDALVRDPDHWEASPPNFDKMKGSDLTNAVKALYGTGGWTTNFAIYSTKTKKL